MSANSPAINSRVLLSRDELLVILRLLSAVALPGLGPDPLGELTVEQQALGLIVAERSLRARELATLDEQGALLIQRGVLELVGSCALAPGTLVVTHVGALQNRAVQWFGHHLDAIFVAHLLPDIVLHQFTQAANRAALVALAGDLAAWPDCPAAPLPPLVLPADVIVAAREQAPQNGDAVRSRLIAANADPASATALTEILAGPHGVTVVQALHRRNADITAVTSITVLSHSAGLWVMTELETGDPGQHRLQPVTRAEAEALISQLEW